MFYRIISGLIIMSAGIACALVSVSGSENSDRFIAKVAVVDVEDILQHSLAIQQIQQSIADLNKNMQNNLIEQEMELKRLEESLIEEKGRISDGLFAEKQQAFNIKVSELQANANKQKFLLDQTHSKAVAKVHDKVIEIIRLLAQKYKFNIVLQSSQVLFVHKELNITTDVIAELNKTLPQIEIPEL
jgi:Skp family chaperone for outer membrane proteins